MDGNTEYTVRGFSPGDEESIVDLLCLVFSEWADRGESAVDHWRWMYLDNPLGFSSIYLTELEGEIVAVAHDLYINVKHGEDHFIAAYGTDAAVHPDHRRKGLYSRLLYPRLEVRAKKSDFQYRYTTNPILLERVNRRHEKEPPFHTMPFDINKHLWIDDIDLHLKMTKTRKPWLKKLGYEIQKSATQIRHLFDESTGNDVFVDINQIDRFDSNIDDLWRKIEPHYDFIVKRDRKYLNWRYCDPRSGDYVILQADDHSETLGYIVSSIIVRQGYPTGYIVDLLASPDRRDVVNALVKAAMNVIKKKGVNTIRALMVKGHPYASTLERNRFIDRGEGLTVNYRRTGSQDESDIFRNCTPDNIYLTYSDLFVV